MKYRNLYIAALLPLVGACTSQTEDIVPTPSDTPVKINTSRAEGTGGGNYALLFWQGSEDITLPSTNVWGTNTWLAHSLAAGTEESQVDYYHFTGGEDYPVTYNNNNTPVYYPADNSPIYAVGYYPQSALKTSNNYQTLTLKDTETPGLVDVCSTDVEQGSESDPFTSAPEHELVYSHTQVRLRFYAMRHKNTYGIRTLNDIKVTVPQNWFANTWTFQTTEAGKEKDTNDNTFVYTASQSEGAPTPTDLVFNSGGVYLPEIGKRYPMNYATDNVCYVMASTVIFNKATATQAAALDNLIEDQYYLTFPTLEATVIDLEGTEGGEEGKTHRKLQWEKVTVPLYRATTDNNGNNTNWDADGNLQNANPVTIEPKPGDSYDIVFVFDNNYFTLWAQKGLWVKGGIIYVPLNPNKQNTETE